MTNWKGYELSGYTDNDIEGIIALVSVLWGCDTSFNRDYFTWKHRRNPFLRGNIGIVAKSGGEVIGFLGYVPAEYKIGDTRFSILQQCDTVIRPEHRGKGLFSEMSKAGIRMYGHEYRFIVNFTSNYMTATGLMKIGFKPLAPVSYLRRFNLFNLARAKLKPGNGTLIKPGKFGNIEVSDNIRSSDIFSGGTANCYSEKTIYLNKIPEFLDWRYANPRARYMCLCHEAESNIDAYMIIRIKNSHAHIFDYGQNGSTDGLQRLFSFIINKTKFASISIFNGGLSDKLASFLRRNHFHSFARIDRIRNRGSSNNPIIIIPAKENYTEDDWFAGGADVRNVANWHITEMCFD